MERKSPTSKKKRSDSPLKQRSEGLEEAGPPLKERTALRSRKLHQLRGATDPGSCGASGASEGRRPETPAGRGAVPRAGSRCTALGAPDSLVSYPWDKND